MPNADHEAQQGDEASAQLEPDEKEEVSKRKSGSSIVLHEVIRLEGEEELDRPSMSLILSGIAAGVSISFSFIGQLVIKARLPEAEWAHLIVPFGYAFGFVIVVYGRLQLFTENTVTAILPIATHPTRDNFVRLARLWSLVLLSNLVGTFFVAWLLVHTGIISPEQREAGLVLAREAAEHSGWAILVLGVPAGFLVASMAWTLPNARGSEFWVIVMISYVITAGGFAHVVAGSSEVWTLVLVGERSFGEAIGLYILPMFVGNVIGGTGLFTVLAHGQVRSELKPDGSEEQDEADARNPSGRRADGPAGRPS